MWRTPYSVRFIQATVLPIIQCSLEEMENEAIFLEKKFVFISTHLSLAPWRNSITLSWIINRFRYSVTKKGRAVISKIRFLV